LNGAGLFAVLIGSWLLVPTHGLMGAAWAILAGSTVTMLGTIALNWSLYKVRREKLCVGQGILAPAKDYADVARNLQ
jgi:O-antigen/teichoic acid export membrane protein